LVAFASWANKTEAAASIKAAIGEAQRVVTGIAIGAAPEARFNDVTVERQCNSSKNGCQMSTELSRQ
jgi:hypothetical protein